MQASLVDKLLGTVHVNNIVVVVIHLVLTAGKMQASLVDKLLGTTTNGVGVVVSSVLVQLLGRGQLSGGVDESCFVTVDHHHGGGQVEKVEKEKEEEDKAVAVDGGLVPTRIMHGGRVGGAMEAEQLMVMAGVPALPRTTDGARQVIIIIGIVALLAGVYSGVLVLLIHRRGSRLLILHVSLRFVLQSQLICFLLFNLASDSYCLIV